MNELALKQLDRFLPVLGGDERIALNVSDSPRGRAHVVRVQAGCARRELGFVSFRRARLQPWDLIVFADHDDMSRFPVCVPKVRIPHGIGRGRTVGGVSYGYSPPWVNYRGRPFYNRMLEASEDDVAFAEACNPALKGVVVAVGHLVADHLLAMNRQRQQVRRKMGYSHHDRVVLLQSTHGPSSLMETVGHDLIEACVELAAEGKWQFIFQTHPHHWVGPRAVSHPYGELLLAQAGKLGVAVIHPDQDWAPHMVASDLAISDYTSLLSVYCLLRKPMLFVGSGEGLVPGNPSRILANTLPRLRSPSTLEDDLNRAVEAFPSREVAEITDEILSYPGEAAERMRREIMALLELPLEDGGQADG